MSKHVDLGCRFLHFHGGDADTFDTLVAFSVELGLDAHPESDVPDRACRFLHFHGGDEAAFNKLIAFAEETLGLEEVWIYAPIVVRVAITTVTTVGANDNGAHDSEEEGKTASA